MSELFSVELRAALRRLELGPMKETLPERLHLARERAMAHQDFLEMILAEECERRNLLAASLRWQRARLDPALQLEVWDDTAKVSFIVSFSSSPACASSTVITTSSSSDPSASARRTSPRGSDTSRVAAATASCW